MSKIYEDDVYNQLKNWREIVKKVKEIVLKLDPSAEVYAFGSVVRGEFTAASDIDVLIVTDNIDEKYQMMVNVYRLIKGPVELHVTTHELYRRWYKRFIDEKDLIKI